MAILVLSAFQVRDAASRGFEQFIVSENKMHFTEDTAFYIAVAPKMCSSCNTQAMRVLSMYAKDKPLYIFCDSNRRQELARHVQHKNAKYITRFDYKWLSKQLFMRSGVAFAGGSRHKLQYVEVINGSSLKKYE